MIIKHPQPENIPALTDLWMQAFGDSREFIERFFCTGFSQDRCLLAEEDSQLLAVLYWFDCLWEGKKIAYLYAIATDQNHRGKGICKALMEYTHEQLAAGGYRGALLVPANEGLVKLYGKTGYSVCCPVSTPATEVPANIQEISADAYRALRGAYLPEGAVEHTEAAFSYLSVFTKFYQFPGGICCGYVENDQLQLQELLPVNLSASTKVAMYRSFTEETCKPSYFALDMG